MESFFDQASKGTGIFAGLNDKEKVALWQGIRFKERQNKENPEHSKYYCDHGSYIRATYDRSVCRPCRIEMGTDGEGN